MTKWIIFVVLGVALLKSAYFWPALIALLLMGILLHLFYRRMTHNWSRPWGGWNDLESGR